MSVLIPKNLVSQRTDNTLDIASSEDISAQGLTNYCTISSSFTAEENNATNVPFSLDNLNWAVSLFNPAPFEITIDVDDETLILSDGTYLAYTNAIIGDDTIEPNEISYTNYGTSYSPSENDEVAFKVASTNTNRVAHATTMIIARPSHSKVTFTFTNMNVTTPVADIAFTATFLKIG